ncbi:DUF2177 family protein [Pseudomonas sp. 21LCFQ02]|uniref:DUF2177 family protein n=1 Tax=unclassified Pseudomonas TaxID=196821 RepID=UPI0004F65057|nr:MULTISPECIES: DUF2177 family protein [unclassified Pseudomonas]MCO8166134.1 DUF2177 family protein [Pseudomonas sp. 21LCFQ010]MCO8171611.1 DUF2177 family protein [Pseudomonas sp. 21LCFQ02]MCQ9425017.1 DUF2177 family protein [Pseudomonas sp. LJDD11]BAP41162.1 putative uncharacterized protein [Pseudomonas sp. StFLB209]
MKRFLTAYAATLVAFLIFDGLWLGGLMGPTYRAWLGPLMLDTPVIGPAVAFYLMYGVGIVVLAVLPALNVQRLGQAVGHSALLGLVAYGTYDLTNWATLRGWPAQMALVDLAWGVVVTTLAGTVAYVLTSRLLR